MFRLFENLFADQSVGDKSYPDWLIEKAIDRAVDGLDSRIRLVRGYRKKLRPGVTVAVEHVDSLVESLGQPIEADPGRYADDPYLRAFFVSAKELQQYFSNAPGIRDYLDNLTGSKPERIYGLLMMDRKEKHVFGVGLDGEMLRRDMSQVTVSFGGHRMVDSTGEEDETRKLLKRRAFDHLIELALHDVSARKSRRLELEKQTTLLRRKLETLEEADLGFEVAESEATKSRASLQRELDDVENSLESLPAKTELLSANLEALVHVLGSAASKLWTDPASVIIDRMHIKRESVSSISNELLLTDFFSANGLTRTGALVSYPTDQLLPPRNFMQEAVRHL